MQTQIRIARDWAIRCFGCAQMDDPRTRALRLLEEAMELAQAQDIELVTAIKVLYHVYSRPKGEPAQELGGILMAAYMYGWTISEPDPSVVFEKELRRVLSLPVEHFSKRNAEKEELFK